MSIDDLKDAMEAVSEYIVEYQKSRSDDKKQLDFLKSTLGEKIDEKLDAQGIIDEYIKRFEQIIPQEGKDTLNVQKEGKETSHVNLFEKRKQQKEGKETSLADVINNNITKCNNIKNYIKSNKTDEVSHEINSMKKTAQDRKSEVVKEYTNSKIENAYEELKKEDPVKYKESKNIKKKMYSLVGTYNFINSSSDRTQKEYRDFNKPFDALRKYIRSERSYNDFVKFSEEVKSGFTFSEEVKSEFKSSQEQPKKQSEERNYDRNDIGKNIEMKFYEIVNMNEDQAQEFAKYDQIKERVNKEVKSQVFNIKAYHQDVDTQFLTAKEKYDENKKQLDSIKIDDKKIEAQIRKNKIKNNRGLMASSMKDETQKFDSKLDKKDLTIKEKQELIKDMEAFDKDFTKFNKIIKKKKGLMSFVAKIRSKFPGSSTNRNTNATRSASNIAKNSEVSQKR